MNISPVSGMQAAQTRHDITAHDVANINTDGYEERTAHQTDTATGGTRISHISRRPNQPDAPSNTDLVEETKEQIINKNLFAANAKVLKTQDEMLGQVIDPIRQESDLDLGRTRVLFVAPGLSDEAPLLFLRDCHGFLASLRVLTHRC